MDHPSPIDGLSHELLTCEAWKPFDWLLHGFSQRSGGYSGAYGVDELNLGFTAEDERENVLRNRERLVEALTKRHAGEQRPELVTIRQIHSSDVHRVNGAQVPEPGDGLMTDRPGKLLAILTADCVPVLVVDTHRRVVAGFHAGWRGTVQGIVQAGVAKMQAEFASREEDLSAAIGPCIGACCYTVGPQVLEEFRSRFAYADELFTGVGRADLELRLDLVEANRRQLLEAGLREENVHSLGECTGCSPQRFFSHRKSGGRTGRMMSVIGIRHTA
jgi:YfiH family protein